MKNSSFGSFLAGVAGIFCEMILPPLRGPEPLPSLHGVTLLIMLTSFLLVSVTFD